MGYLSTLTHNLSVFCVDGSNGMGMRMEVGDGDEDKDGGGNGDGSRRDTYWPPTSSLQRSLEELQESGRVEGITGSSTASTDKPKSAPRTYTVPTIQTMLPS